MKNLKAGIIALILTTIVFACNSQTSTNKYELLELVSTTTAGVYDHEYLNIQGLILNSESKNDKIYVSLYVLNDDCSWSLIEENKSTNKYNFYLDQESEYQVWFHDLNNTKCMYISPGYTGPYIFNINVDFSKTQSLYMSPSPYNSNEFVIKFMSFDDLFPLIYQDGVIKS